MITINITLDELNKWGKKSLDWNSSKCESILHFIKDMEGFPPRGVLRLARPLIISEGVDPNNLEFKVTDTDTNKVYEYKPELAPCFKSRYKPVEIDPEITESLNSVLS